LTLPGLVLLLACSGRTPPATPAPQTRELRVAVATSLSLALRELAAEFEQGADAPRVEIRAAASEILLQQIVHGADVDLFISASPLQVDALERQGLLAAGGREPVASNRLVVVVPAGGDGPGELDRLAEARFARIAVANPRTAPLGTYTRQALESATVHAALEPRLIYANDARQTLEYVARGEADAGIVYGTDPRLVGERVAVAGEIPGELHPPILYEAAQVAGPAPHPAADLFLDHLRSPRGRALLARHGFRAPP
jgi:molybdate transport system substrate-binding protein